jgi:hypothetical protein
MKQVCFRLHFGVVDNGPTRTGGENPRKKASSALSWPDKKSSAHRPTAPSIQMANSRFIRRRYDEIALLFLCGPIEWQAYLGHLIGQRVYRRIRIVSPETVTR